MGKILSAKAQSVNLERAIFLVVLLLAVLMTIKYFPGLENESAYAGNVFQIINPDAFAGDPYRGPEQPQLSRPLQLSLMYVFPKILGEIWLDERFLVFVYIGLVFAGLIGIDRTAVLFGLNGFLERLLLLSYFAKDHQILATKVLLAHHQDVNHSAFALPIIVWLFYVTLARKSLWIVLGLGILLSLMSIRAAFFPLVSCLLAIAIIGSRTERRVIIGLFTAGCFALLWALLVKYDMPDVQRLALWDFIKSQEGDDANPFENDSSGYWWPRNLGWLAVIGAALFVFRSSDDASRRANILLMTAIAIWFFGGLYISYSPDVSKFPLLIGFAPTRATAWPQNLAYVILVARLIWFLSETDNTNKKLLTMGIMAALFIVGPGNFDLWAGLLAVSFLAVLGSYTVMSGKMPILWIANAPVKIMVLTITVVLGVAYAMASWQQAPAWSVLIHHGVYGNSIAAKWIGVAEYFRTSTPKGSIVLPFYCSNPKACEQLTSLRGLATRSGKALIVSDVYGHDFMEPEAWRRDAQQREIVEQIGHAFTLGKPQYATTLMNGLLRCPDYIVLPTIIWTRFASQVHKYTEIKQIRNFTILQQQCPVG